MKKSTLTKIDPDKGVTYEQYVAVCKAMGVESQPEDRNEKPSKKKKSK